MNRLSVLVAILVVGCASDASIPDLGEKLDLPPNSELLVVAAAQMMPHQEMFLAGIKFEVAANEKHRIAYISTHDPKFRTPEGLTVGSTLAQVLAVGAKTPMAEAGWAYHTQLPSGWSAAFISLPGLTNAPLQPDSKVSWFFKRQ
jgi:hypothetical protein